ncbi:MAG: class I SAM-dependent methyltransferase [Eubacteriales bacterium]|nr:class I SAM-dependent methyltransferase [Eubacteriales bacterium]
MKDYTVQNKRAWKYNAYDFWVRTAGSPAELAARVMADPVRSLKRYARYFDAFEGVRVANICGSCGKKALPLALLGAEVTVFDISEDNRRYALEAADAAHVTLGYEVGDVLDVDLARFGGSFDVVFMEGGVLHDFHDLDEFMRIMHTILRKGGKLICSDFHPFTKIADILQLQQPTMSYFSTEVFEGEMAHARFFDESVRRQMPRCSYRKHTVSEIINAIIASVFCLQRFDGIPPGRTSGSPASSPPSPSNRHEKSSVCFAAHGGCFLFRMMRTPGYLSAASWATASMMASEALA